MGTAHITQPNYTRPHVYQFPGSTRLPGMSDSTKLLTYFQYFFVSVISPAKPLSLYSTYFVST
jgi:hypothetical protein